MQSFPPPVTIVRVPKQYGSAGYGAKLDGNKICIPFNPSVLKHLPDNIQPLNVVTMPREEFNNLPMYEGM